MLSNGEYRCLLIISIFLFVAVPGTLAAQLPQLSCTELCKARVGDDQRLCQNFCETLADAADTYSRVKPQVDQRSGVGVDLAKDFSPGGSQIKTDLSYRDHPWLHGNPDFMKVWMIDDTMKIMEHLGSCYDFKIETRICHQEFRCDCGLTGCTCWISLYFPQEFNWPEVVTETNDFAIGSFWAGQIREPLIALKESMMDSFAGMPSIMGGYKKRSEAGLPEGLSKDPHIGHSATDDQGYPGQLGRNYEAHVYRTFFDLVLTPEIYKMNPFVPLKCYPKRDNNLMLHWSEALAPIWRVSGFSNLRLFPPTPKPYREYYENAYWQSLLSAMDPRSSSCASYRAKKFKNPIATLVPGIIPNDQVKGMEVNCYQHASLGQLFPIVGNVETNAETTAALVAGRRFLEWSSSELAERLNITGSRKTNFFNDRPGRNLYRKDGVTTIGDDRRADKLQSIDPDNSGCFNIEEADERNRSLFPKGLLRPDQLGNRKWVHWNARACCVEMIRIYVFPSFAIVPVPPGQGDVAYVEE